MCLQLLKTRNEVFKRIERLETGVKYSIHSPSIVNSFTSTGGVPCTLLKALQATGRHPGVNFPQVTMINFAVPNISVNFRNTIIY